MIGAPGEDWRSITNSIRFGSRGLARPDTLPRVLSRYYGHRNRGAIPPLSEAEIIRWARRHRAQTGRWPNTISGPVIGVRGESCQEMDIRAISDPVTRVTERPPQREESGLRIQDIAGRGWL